MTAVLDRRAGLTVVFCSRCGRPLTAPVSRARRIGPCCLAWQLRVARAAAKPDR